jgi:hypothetical protein
LNLPPLLAASNTDGVESPVAGSEAQGFNLVGSRNFKASCSFVEREISERAAVALQQGCGRTSMRLTQLASKKKKLTEHQRRPQTQKGKMTG